jgi:hypothetical protein
MTEGKRSGDDDTSKNGVVIQRVIHEVGGGSSYSTLTKSNYSDWVLLMKVKLKAQTLWSVIENGGADQQEEMMALAALCTALPPEMVPMIIKKETAKEAWDAIVTMRVGDDCVKKVTAQQLRRKFDLVTFDDRETVEDYVMRLSTMAAHLATLDEEVKDGGIIMKMLRSLPPCFKKIMIAIKTLLDVSTMSVTELGWLKEEAFEEASTSLQQDKKLYLTEEEWDTWRKKHEAENNSDSGARGGGSSSSRSSSKPTGDECWCCGKMGHWARKRRWKPKEQSQVVQDEEEASLMLTSATLNHPEVISSNAKVEIHEEKVFTHLDEEKERDVGTWVLDTGVTNHMSGCRAAFMKIDMVVLGIVHFGDDSVAWIEGHGTAMFVCKNGESRSFDGVYFIPRLMTNIVSIGPLDEISYKIDIDTSMMKIRQPSGVLLVKVKWEVNRLYLLHLKFTQPTCLAVRGRSDEVAWRWHERIRHVNMAALQKLAREELVHGLPEIGQVGQLFETCQAGKQRRTSFPVKVEYQAERRIELVHGDLCGPISPTTSRGNKYFLLLVNDLSRYMWVAMIRFKDHAAAAIKDIQAWAEGESGLKLKALHTDHGGEFNVTEFADYYAAEDVHHQHTMSYSPQQNDVVQRWNGTMVATARSMLKAKGLPGWF